MDCRRLVGSAAVLISFVTAAAADEGSNTSTDVVELTDGSRVEGHIEQQELGKYIAIRLADGSQQIINWVDVKRVLPAAPSTAPAPVSPTPPPMPEGSGATQGSAAPDPSGHALGPEVHEIAGPVLDPAEAHVRGVLGLGVMVGYAGLSGTFKDGFYTGSYGLSGRHVKVTVDRNRWAVYFAYLSASGPSDDTGSDSRSMSMTGFGIAYGQRYREHFGRGLASALQLDVGIYLGTDTDSDPNVITMDGRPAWLVPINATYTFSYALSRDVAFDAQLGLGYVTGEDFHEENASIQGVLVQLNAGVHL